MAFIGTKGYLHRGNFEDDWNSDIAVATCVAGARMAIDDITDQGMIMIRDVHPNWERKTGQLEDACFRERAIIEPSTKLPGSPHVWGYFGVRDTPRWRESKKTGERRWRRTRTEGGQWRALTNMDVAMFLEFGTARMEPKTPWLYAAWDTVKRELPARMEVRCTEVAASGTPTALRAPSGRFISPKGIL
jgi:hypothetical protein